MDHCVENFHDWRMQAAPHLHPLPFEKGRGDKPTGARLTVMTTQQFLTSAWTWNPAVFISSGVALAAYLWAVGLTRRVAFLIAGLGVFVLTLVSPLNALADGYLFSAHMLQHILLLLIVPALLLMSLPRCVSLGPRSWLLANPLVGWVAGVGAMWLWHAGLFVMPQFLHTLWARCKLLRFCC